jgi:metal-dependent amidase/aminoacylase/carboxypeptidase family protein
MREQITAALEQVFDELVEVSRDIHARPELGYEEHFAAERVCASPRANGFAVERRAAGLDTAFRAVRGSGELSIAFCAEYDALPDVGHACGHNLIAASSLGAALALGGGR